MHYVYTLRSGKDNRFYTGFTNDLKRRLEERNRGDEIYTRHKRPLKLIYFEGCMSKQDAIAREKYLKSGWGKKYLKNRLKHYLMS